MLCEFCQMEHKKTYKVYSFAIEAGLPRDDMYFDYMLCPSCIIHFYGKDTPTYLTSLRKGKPQWWCYYTTTKDSVFVLSSEGYDEDVIEAVSKIDHKFDSLNTQKSSLMHKDGTYWLVTNYNKHILSWACYFYHDLFAL